MRRNYLTSEKNEPSYARISKVQKDLKLKKNSCSQAYDALSLTQNYNFCFSYIAFMLYKFSSQSKGRNSNSRAQASMAIVNDTLGIDMRGSHFVYTAAAIGGISHNI